MSRLIFEKGVRGESLIVESVKAARWDTTALGCPAPGVYYDTQGAPFDGFAYVLSEGTNTWEFHTDEADTVTVDCNDIDTLTTAKVNITREAKLQGSTGLVLMRRNFSTGQFVEDDPISPDDMARLVSIFDIDTRLSEPGDCTTVFRLDFSTSVGTEEIGFICEENYREFNIVWQGMMGSAPILGKIIGPYLTGDPIPTLPTAIP